MISNPGHKFGPIVLGIHFNRPSSAVVHVVYVRVWYEEKRTVNLLAILAYPDYWLATREIAIIPMVS